MTLTRALALLVPLAALPSATALGQAPSGPWYAGVWPVDGQTLLVVRPSTGQEVRSGPHGPRHGVRVPLVIEDGGDSVRFDIEARPDHATRWIVRRDGRDVRIEEWARRGPAGVAWEQVRVVRRAASP